MATRFGGVLAVFVLSFGLMAEELQLDQAVRLALQHNIDITNSVLDVSKAKDRSAAFRS
jgi:hypothetical protein